jgi:RNA polymerase sigma-70 factor (ECF subfamily)
MTGSGGAPRDLADDRSLVDRAAHGDRDAFGMLVRRHQDRAFNLAYQVLRNREDALDVAQEAFVKAFASLPGFKAEASFTTWLHRIVVNLAIDGLRRRRRSEGAEYDDRRAVAEDAVAERAAPGDPAAELEMKQVRGLLARGIAALPPAQRAVLVLREIEGMSYHEIAAAVGCSLGTVMSRLFYGRRKLQRIFQAHLSDLR